MKSLTRAALATSLLSAFLIAGVGVASAVADSPAEPDAGTALDTINVSDAPSPSGDSDAGAADDGSTAQATPDASAPGCTCRCPSADTDASSTATPDASESTTAPRSTVETAIIMHVFLNQRLPQGIIDALTCEEVMEVRAAIWGRHGYYFADDQQRQEFMNLYDGLYVPLLHINAITIENYLTARDNLNLMLLSRSAFHKGCHRSAPAP